MRLANEVPAEVRDEQYRLQTHRKHRRVPELAGSGPEEKFRNNERNDAPLKRNFKGFEEALFHFFIVLHSPSFLVCIAMQKAPFGAFASGAQERTRTSTPCGTSTSRMLVYQFQHLGMTLPYSGNDHPTIRKALAIFNLFRERQITPF